VLLSAYSHPLFMFVRPLALLISNNLVVLVFCVVQVVASKHGYKEQNGLEVK
jgi:hypothetical protein